MRVKRSIYNSASTALLQILTIISGLILPRLFIKTYGSSINGLINSINQFVSYFSLVEAGLSGAVIFVLYKPLAKNDYETINGVLSATKEFYNKSGFIFSGLVLALSILYPFLVNTDSLPPQLIVLLVLVIGIAGALEFFTMSKYRVLLASHQKTYIISNISSIAIVVNFLIIYFCIEYRLNIVLVRALALFSFVVRSILLHMYVRKNYPNVNYNVKPITEGLNKRWDVMYLQLLGLVHTATPVIILTVFCSLTMVSVYSIYNMVMASVLGILSIFNNGLSASFGDVIAKKENNVLKKAFQQFEFLFYLLITWIYSCTQILLIPFIRIYTGDIHDAEYILPGIGFLFVLLGICYNIKTPQGMLISSAGLFKETRLQTFIQALIGIVFSLLLVKPFGIAGVLIGGILSNIYRDIDLLIFVPKNITFTKIRTSVFRVIRIFILFFISVLPFYCYINIQTLNFGMWMVWAGVVTIWVSFVVLLGNYLFEKHMFLDVCRLIGRIFIKGSERIDIK